MADSRSPFRGGRYWDRTSEAADGGLEVTVSWWAILGSNQYSRYWDIRDIPVDFPGI